MLYAILAYHVEAEVTSWTPEQDAAVMTGLLAVHDRLNANKLLVDPYARTIDGKVDYEEPVFRRAVLSGPTEVVARGEIDGGYLRRHGIL